MRNYAVDRLDLAWAGLDLKEGILQGTFLQEALSSPARWNMRANGMGRVVRSWNPDRSGTVTITVGQETSTHRKLYTLLQEDELLHNVVKPMVATDLSSGEEFRYVNAFILGEPNESRGTEAAAFAWVFGFERKSKTVPTEDQNIVGD